MSNLLPSGWSHYGTAIRSRVSVAQRDSKNYFLLTNIGEFADCHGYPELYRVNDNNLRSIAVGMTKVIPKLADAQGIVLVITDSMAMKMLRDLSTNYDPGDRTEKDLRFSAVHGYPAMSSIVLNVRQSHNGKKRVYPSRLFMRPLTSIGECTQADPDVDNYRAKK
ncbi:unnamed protein product [Cylicostephanus goldi]|uniref:Uncharacterized protein n=1 Tax=Cylicostephanus goldi TaxID=71465 RepID=A0A3P7MEA3_CYLGO|nr:unnamed protein product [Cylicostephanus goldi]